MAAKKSGPPRDLLGRFEKGGFDTDKGERALRLRFEGKSWPAIAQEIGVDRVTLWRWRTAGQHGYNEAFAKLAHAATAALVDDVVDEILAISHDKNLTDRDSAAAARVKTDAKLGWLKLVAPQLFVQRTDVTSDGKELAPQKVLIIPADANPNDLP